jgi:hypothetical protein
MNKQKISEMRYKRVRIRPVARRVDQSGIELPQIDDVWLVTSAPKGEMNLENTRTGHNVREYMTDIGRTDGFLILKSQVTLYARGYAVEPLF